MRNYPKWIDPISAAIAAIVFVAGTYRYWPPETISLGGWFQIIEDRTAAIGWVVGLAAICAIGAANLVRIILEGIHGAWQDAVITQSRANFWTMVITGGVLIATICGIVFK